MLLKVENLNKTYDGKSVLKDINFTLNEGEVVCFLGPSGCGKSTLLRILADLEKANSGKISNGLSKMGFIFQEPRLLPWLNTYENIDLVLKDQIESSDERKKVIDRVLKEVNLYEFKDYYPKKLSGGMKQRAAIARALAVKSKLLLMDEPFSNLDFPLRLDLIKLLSRIFEEEGVGGVFVTHDTREAVLLGDRIMVLTEEPGEIESTTEIKIKKSERYLESEEISQYNRILNHYLCQNMGPEHMRKHCRLMKNFNFSCKKLLTEGEIDNEEEQK